MARLPDGERKNRSRKIFHLLRNCRLGLRESEIAADLGIDRRTVNNYLRDLKGEEKAYKDGRLWFTD